MLNATRYSVFFLLLGGILSLTACEKTTTTVEKPKTIAPNSPTAYTVVASTNSATTAPHMGHNMSEMPTSAVASSTVQTSSRNAPAHISAYHNAMANMMTPMQQMMQNPNPDVAFAKGMAVHHQGAIEMAKVELEFGKDSQMRQLAKNITQAQTNEILQLNTWVTQHANTLSNAGKTQKMDEQLHHHMMAGIEDPDPDIAFAKGMIPHHQMAIQMADFELKNGKDPQMLKLAKQITSAQDPEIKQMQAWLKSKGQ